MQSQEFSVNKQSNRNFGLVFAAFFLILALIQWYYTGSTSISLVGLSASCIILAIFIPSVLQPFNILWLKFGFVLNKIMSPIIMSLVFFLLITPISLVMRILGKRTLNIGFNPNLDSYWIPYNSSGPEKDTMKNQF